MKIGIYSSKKCKVPIKLPYKAEEDSRFAEWLLFWVIEDQYQLLSICISLKTKDRIDGIGFETVNPLLDDKF